MYKCDRRHADHPMKKYVGISEIACAKATPHDDININLTMYYNFTLTESWLS